MKIICVLTLIFLLCSCNGIPKNIQPVKNFSANKYFGTWYEIARFDHFFERGLSKVTAKYTQRKDGGIDVINTGFSDKEQAWKKAKGKAYFVRNRTTGYLKVSFFAPFYSSYIIFKLDSDNYQYAYVTSYNKNYLWLLSRTPTVSDFRKKDFLKTSEKHDFKIKNIIFINQTI